MSATNTAASTTTQDDRFAISFDAPTLLERFFVFGAVGFIGTRILLALTGYPQIGGHGLHIAHLLWGGLLMLVSIVMMLSFLGRDVRGVCAVAAGLGWGLFIDELGKFITSDVNYFYKPAIALIYATFVILFVALRGIASRRAASGPESVAQALEIWQSAVLRGWRVGEKEQVRRLLAQAPDDPTAAKMMQALLASPPETAHKPNLMQRVTSGMARWYDVVRGSRLFIPVIGAMAALVVATNFAELISEITRNPHFRGGNWSPSWFDVLKSLTTLVSSALLGMGLWRLRTDKLAGFKLMKSGILVALLLGQLLAFYTQQLLALWGLLLHLVLLVGVDYAIQQEELLVDGRPDGASADQPPQETAALFRRRG